MSENNWEYIIKFTEKASAEAQNYIRSVIKDQGLIVEHESTREGGILKIRCSHSMLCNQAKKLEIRGENDVIPENDFLPCERNYLYWRILEGIETTDGFSQFAAKSHLFRSEVKRSLIKEARVQELIELILPLHDKEKQKRLWTNCTQSWFSNPIKEIRDYFGEQIGFYFAWMQYYVAWLIGPSIAFFILLTTKENKIPVEHNPLAPFFSLFVVLWGSLFVIFWNRTSNCLAWNWGTYDANPRSSIRTDFYGEVITSPVTGQPERYYSKKKRYVKLCVSAIITLFLLVIAVGVMFLLLNVQGYIVDPYSPFYVPQLSHLAQPGAIFDPQGNLSFIPTFLYVLIIQIFNKTYRKISTILTDWENWRTVIEAENSLVFKRVIFEACDCYCLLFYIAFYQFDIPKLRTELFNLYIADVIRRLSTEVGIPYVLYLFNSKKSKPQNQIQDELFLNEYECFDDYLEMVIQFGYIVFFASAFPMAGFLSLLSNIIELRSDLFKLTWVSQRPIIHGRVKNIGVWFTILQSMTTISVLTNCIIFGMTSELMADYFPDWFSQTVNGNEIVQGMGKYVIFLIFLVEHVLILVISFLRGIISEKPKWLQIAIEKRDYEREKASKLKMGSSSSNLPEVQISKIYTRD